MKYFTRDWYKEMQLSGFVKFIESIEEWEEMEQDYKQSLKEEVEERKEELLKFLPESLHPYIHNNTINSECPPDKLKKFLLEWNEDYEKKITHLDQSYIEYFNFIKKNLPSNVVQLHEFSLHDSVVLSTGRTSKDTLTIFLDCSGTFSAFDKLQVIFTGVTKCSIPENFEGAWWLYHEIELTEDGLELGVLFDCPFREVKICVRDVLLEKK
ncbi:DUF4085 family protein [Bacillus cereus]|uniref:DUF4085 domain-containing protein n=1 Tax=Bacillus cereus HuA4-10 TaxID=1053206 RepID=J8DRC5_BACCE|nr:DUF4085 family protein [Bacillus cereus]EJQ78829.1 hypothetical protein IGC_02744 [Bacillus cereus HuA4-10]